MGRRLAWVCGLLLALPQFADAQLAPAPFGLLSLPGKPWGMSLDLQGGTPR